MASGHRTLHHKPVNLSLRLSRKHLSERMMGNDSQEFRTLQLCSTTIWHHGLGVEQHRMSVRSHDIEPVRGLSVLCKRIQNLRDLIRYPCAHQDVIYTCQHGSKHLRETW